MGKGIHVTSEFGKLKRVLVHRPGAEVENLTPDTYEELLFDDAMYLPKAQEEHDAFTDALRKEGVEVYYIEQLVADTLDLSDEIKQKFISDFIIEAGVEIDSEIYPAFQRYLNTFATNKEMVDKCIAGIRYTELGETGTLIQKTAHELFVSKPMPNSLFQRDPFASVVNGITLHTMLFETRKRETLLCEYVFDHHPDFKDVPRYYRRTKSSSLEGGDVMMLNEKTLAIGISQRTAADSVQKVAKKVFADPDNTIETVYGIDIPKGRSWMHLDTVFTQIDKHTFSIHENAPFDIYKITDAGNGEVLVEKSNNDISGLMEKVFGGEAKLIKCGGGDPIHSVREQWNDGSNVLAIAPNTVVAYDRNYITVELMRSEGVNVITVPSSELSRGRGGPRCMTMPLEREDI